MGTITKEMVTSSIFKYLAFWVKFSADYIEIFFNMFSREQILIFDANCLQWRQFASNIKTCFLGKIRKINIISLSSAELAQAVVKVKTMEDYIILSLLMAVNTFVMVAII